VGTAVPGYLNILGEGGESGWKCFNIEEKITLWCVCDVLLRCTQSKRGRLGKLERTAQFAEWDMGITYVTVYGIITLLHEKKKSSSGGMCEMGEFVSTSSLTRQKKGGANQDRGGE
jgi:hypothetical protein